MRKDITLGSKKFFIIGIILVYICYLAIMAKFESKESVVFDKLADGEIYSLSTKSEVVLRVLDIEKTNIELDDNIFYLVEHDNGLVMVLAEKDDKEIQELMDNREKLTTDSYYLIGKNKKKTERKGGRRSKRTVTNVSDKLQENFKYIVDTSYNFSEKEDKQLIPYSYVSLPEYDSSKNFSFWFGIGLGIIGILCFMASVRTVRRNKMHYDKLYEYHPETYRNMSIIKTDAEYFNKKLKLAIYKNSLITFNRNFFIENINNIDKIYINQNKTGVFLILNGDNVSQRETYIKKLRKKQLKKNLKEFREFMRNNYPDKFRK